MVQGVQALGAELGRAQLDLQCTTPSVLLNEVISAKDLLINQRVVFLKITVKYCNYYKELYKNNSKERKILSKRQENVVLFVSDLIDDLITTAITIKYNHEKMK